jgi:hypothetical protein
MCASVRFCVSLSLRGYLHVIFLAELLCSVRGSLLGTPRLGSGSAWTIGADHWSSTPL